MSVVHIGNTIWNRGTIAITPPRAGVDRQVKNDGSVKLKGTARRAEPSGQGTTTSIVRREADALLLEQLAGAMQGRRVMVACNGVLFAGVRVDSVEVHHRKVAWDQYLITARWSFGPASSQNHDDPKDRFVPSKVETCRVWGEWVERKSLVATTASEVFGPFGSVIGNAMIVQTLDPEAVDEAGEPDTAARTLADCLGHYVRISLPEGTPDQVTVATTFTPAWHGRILQRSIGDDQGRVTAGYSCVDLSHLFEVWLTSWYERNDDGTVADGTEIPPFNAIPSGERSSGTPGPDNTHVHDRTATVGNVWRNSHIAALLIAAFNQQFPDGPTITLAGQTSALDNFQGHDLDGSSVREQLGQLICRGIGCRITVAANDGTVSLHLNTGIQAAITAGDWTVPANDRQTTIDLHDLDDLVGWNLDEDVSLVADRILYQLGLPWYCGSLGIKDDDTGQFRKTWSGSDATTWDDLPEADRDNPDQCHIWRRWLLHKDWVGATYNVAPFTIDVGRTTTTNATHGTNGENGEFSNTGNNRFPWAALRFTKSLPLTIGDDWTEDPYGISVKPNRALERPAVFAVTDPGGDETWERLDLQVVVDDDYPAIILGKDQRDAVLIRDRLQAGQHLVVTIGWRLPKPWRVSWRRDPSARLFDQERTVLYQRPDFDYRYIMNGTVVGVDDGAPKVQETGGIIGGVPSSIPVQLLGIGRLVHEHPQRGLTWTRQRIDLTAALAPGAFITTATLPYGEDADTSDDEGPETDRTVNAPIGVRSWNLDRDKPSTTWSTTRLATDVVLRPRPTGPTPSITNLAGMVYST